MAKKIFILIIFLMVFGLLFFNLGKTEEVEAMAVGQLVAAMKTLVDGYFYVPSIKPAILKVDRLFDNSDLVGDQTGGSGIYPYTPDGQVNQDDLNLVYNHFNSAEGGALWEYMADVVPDRKIETKDYLKVANNSNKTGNYYRSPLTGVTIEFRDSENNFITETVLDADEMARIPSNADNFTVKRNGQPIGAYVLFYDDLPNLFGFAWSDKIGWISFNCASKIGDEVMKVCDGGVNKNKICNAGFPEAVACPGASCVDACSVVNYGVYLTAGGADERYFRGYAWSPNIGWIRFNPPPPYPNGLVTKCADDSAYLLYGNQILGLIRACAGAPDPATCGGQPSANPEEPNPNSGGWNGWICLQGAGDYPYEVSLNTTTNEFEGWAWGGGGSDLSNAVIGWISWNCKDRAAATGKTCVDNVTDPSTQLWDYKVTYQPSNFEPTASNAKITGTDYCTKSGDSNGVQKGQVSFSWDYTDFEGDYHERYWLQIATDPTFTNKVIDCQVPTHPLIKVDPNVPHLMTSGVDVVSSTSTEYTNRCQNGDELVTGKYLAISYGGTYFWQVASKECQDPPACTEGNWSNWTIWDVDGIPGPDSFTTHTHASPWPDFDWDPHYPAVYQNVTFDAQPGTLTRFYDATCTTDPTDASCSYSWIFTDANVNSNPPPPPPYQEDAQFQTEGAKPVTLQVTDSSGFSCPATKPVQVGFPLPKWKEIPPTF